MPDSQVIGQLAVAEGVKKARRTKERSAALKATWPMKSGRKRGRKKRLMSVLPLSKVSEEEKRSLQTLNEWGENEEEEGPLNVPPPST